MKKLRLIKPWRLRATRQKLSDARWGTDYEVVTAAWTRCTGPVAAEWVSSRFDTTDIRGAVNHRVHDVVRTAAPRADVIFASTKNSIR